MVNIGDFTNPSLLFQRIYMSAEYWERSVIHISLPSRLFVMPSIVPYERNLCSNPLAATPLNTLLCWELGGGKMKMNSFCQLPNMGTLSLIEKFVLFETLYFTPSSIYEYINLRNRLCCSCTSFVSVLKQ